MESRQVLKDSHTRQYVKRLAEQPVDDGRVTALEQELDESERRNLRLNRELLEETTIRARLEREMSKLSEQLTETEEKLGGRPQRIAKRSATGRAVPKDAVQDDRGSNESAPEVSPEPRQSSRKRGGVK